MPEEKKCFVISPIGEPKTETRKNSDLLFNHVIKPVLKEFEYDVERADKIGEPGIITSQIIQRIEKSPLVIADLTGPNANVFYELAIRHAIRKPLIQLITKGQPIPFDVAGLRTITFDLKDLDSVDDTKKEIRKQIESITKGSFKMDTPISTAIDLMNLKESGNPEQISLAKVTDMLTIMSRDIRRLSIDLSRSRGTFMSRNELEKRNRIRQLREQERLALRHMRSLSSEELDNKENPNVNEDEIDDAIADEFAEEHARGEL